MSDNTKILVGKIVAAQGLRGEVRVQTYTENPLDLRDMQILVGADYIRPRAQDIAPLQIKFVRAIPNSTVVIARVDGVNDRTAAEKLRGTELFIDRGALPVLGAGEYYAADLVGMSVGDETVVAVQNYGAGDILELSDGRMVSFAGATVDLENGAITLK